MNVKLIAARIVPQLFKYMSTTFLKIIDKLFDICYTDFGGFYLINRKEELG